MTIFNHPHYIILHHSLTKDSKTVSWQAIRRYHKSLGWQDIGYHIGIELINNDYEVLIGRPWTTKGAHCTQNHMNSRSIGLCFVGNFDNMPPKPALWAKGLKVSAMLCSIYNISPNNIRGHREYATYKTCPGLEFDVEKFRNNVKEII